MSIYSGIVQEGDHRAEALGFPTINIPFTGNEWGIFVGTVSVEGKHFEAVLYADQKRCLLEAHLLDFKGNLYGASVSMELLQKIRDDKHFESDETLEQAIAGDVSRARHYFSERRSHVSTRSDE